MLAGWRWVVAVGVISAARALGQTPAAPATQFQIDQARGAHLTKLMREVYGKSAWRDERWDAAVGAVHEAAAKWLVEGLGEQEEKQITALTDRCVKEGCADPVVLELRACLVRDADQATDEELSRRAMEKLPESGYPQAFTVEAAIACARHEADPKGAKADEYRKGAADALMKIAKDDSLPGTLGLWHRFELLDIYLSDENRVTTAGKFVERCKTEPGLDPWLMHMASGDIDVTLAWMARGKGWGPTVTKEGWDRFGKALDKAREHFEAAYQLHPDLPQPSWEMIRVAMAGRSAKGEDTWFWFERATKASADYYPAYSAMLWALRPRWGGSHEEMLKLGMRAAGLKRFDTDVSLVLADAVTDVAEETGDVHEVLARPKVWQTLDKALAAMFDEPGHKEDRAFLIATRIAMASEMHEDVLAAELCLVQDAARLPHRNDVIDRWELDSKRLGAMNKVLGSKHRERALAALDAQRQDHFADAIRIYSEIEEAAKDDYFVHVGAAELGALAGLERAVKERDSYTWPAGKSGEVACLRTAKGSWNYREGNIRAMDTGGLRAYVPVPVGGRYEVSVEIEAVQSAQRAKAGEKPQARNAGVLVGYQPGGDDSIWYAAQLALGEDAVIVGRNWNDKKSVRVPNLGWSAKLRVQVWDQNVAVFVNDTMVSHERGRDWQAWGSYFGLGGFNKSSGGGATYKGLKVTVLKDAPEWVKGMGPVEAAPVDMAPERRRGPRF